MIKKYKSLKVARLDFIAGMPQILDSWTGFRDIPQGHKDIRIVSWHGQSEATHTRSCPDYDHDCWKENCGQEWEESWDHGARLIVDGEIIAEWVNYERGGIGF